MIIYDKKDEKNSKQNHERDMCCRCKNFGTIECHVDLCLMDSNRPNYVKKKLSDELKPILRHMWPLLYSLVAFLIVIMMCY